MRETYCVGGTTKKVVSCVSQIVVRNNSMVKKIFLKFENLHIELSMAIKLMVASVSL